ncbi:LamG-like jellyroll fold domain-containing protein [Haloferula sp.]|uniref:LamG-like jellyroll fold domain-containing protein n=1 Tax=Haloferula sp. TaxID=2497595 RepID=UPI003C77A450
METDPMIRGSWMAAVFFLVLGGSCFGLTAEKQAEELFARGEAAETRGDYETALVCWKLALRMMPEHQQSSEKIEGIRKRVADGAFKPGVKRIEKKLKNIVIPEFGLRYERLSNLLNYLSVRSKELDTEGGSPEFRGVTFHLEGPNRWVASADSAIAIRALGLRDVTAGEALEFLCNAGNLQFRVGDDGVFISPKGWVPPSPVPVSPTAQRAATKTFVWRSLDGKELAGDYVGLDGEAVVVNSSGREATLPFSRLDAESIAQAKRLSINDDVLLHYDFNDGSGGIVKDLSNKGRDGKLVGFDNLAAGAGNLTRSSGWARTGGLNFDGKDDHVTTPLEVDEFVGSSFTIEAIVTHNDVKDDWSPIVSTTALNYDEPGVVQLAKPKPSGWNSPPSELLWRLNGLIPEKVGFGRPTSLCDGSFHHVALVFNREAGEVRVYFDHHLLSIKSEVGGELFGGQQILVGASGWNASERWFGLMAELRISKAALEPELFLMNPSPVETKAPVPVHRWSFDGDLSDSIGGAHGTMVDPRSSTASFIDGQLDLSKNSGEKSADITEDAFVDLPNGLVDKIDGPIAFELWCNPTKWQVWCAFFRFERGVLTKGESTAAGSAGDYAAIGISQRARDNDLFGFLNMGSKSWFSDSGLDVNIGGERHFVMILDSDDKSVGVGGTQFLYLDGYLLAKSSMPEGFLKDFRDNNNWLGRSSGGDPTFVGFYNEFRIYDKALTAAEVLASYRAGPDVVYSR